MKHTRHRCILLWTGWLVLLLSLAGLSATQNPPQVPPPLPPSPFGPPPPLPEPANPLGQPPALLEPANPLEQPPAPVQAPAPAWVKLGLRLSYYSSAAVVAPGDERYVRDERGDYFDQQGNIYSKAAGGGAGHGFTQITVAGLDATAVALDVRSYGYPRYQGPLALITSSCAVGAPANPSDWWMSPVLLQQALTQGGPGTNTRVFRGAYKADRATYKAVWFYVQGRESIFDPNTVTPEGNTLTTRTSRHMWVYDEGTGILLLSTHAVDIGKGIGLNRAKFVSARPLTLPAPDSPVPPWTAQISTLEYTGKQIIPFPGGRGSADRPMTATLTFGQRGANWTQARLAIDLRNVQGFEWMKSTNVSADCVAGTGQFGGVWMPPQVLATLRQGQVLDRDPVTQVQVRVAQVAGNTITISESTSIQRIDATYDRRTGMMVQYGRTDTVPAEIRTVLRLARQQ